MACAVAMTACSVYSDDPMQPVNEGAPVEGDWSLRVDLNPCVATPAAVPVEIQIGGDDVTVSVAGEALADAPKMVRTDTDARIEFLTSLEPREMWAIDLTDDGEVAEAWLTWSNGKCEIAGRAVSVTRQ